MTVNNSPLLKYYSCDILRTTSSQRGSGSYFIRWDIVPYCTGTLYIINKHVLPLLLFIVVVPIIIVIIITHILSTRSRRGSAETGRCAFTFPMDISSSCWLSALRMCKDLLLITTTLRAPWWIGTICISKLENRNFRPSNLSKVKTVPVRARI